MSSPTRRPDGGPTGLPRCGTGLPRRAWLQGLAAGLLAAAAGPLRADDDDDDEDDRDRDRRRRRDHDRARAAVQAGEVMPLPALLERLKRGHPGVVLELELERKRDRWVYEVKQLQPSGRLVKLVIDARTGELVKSSIQDGGAPAAPPPSGPPRR